MLASDVHVRLRAAASATAGDAAELYRRSSGTGWPFAFCDLKRICVDAIDETEFSVRRG